MEGCQVCAVLSLAVPGWRATLGRGSRDARGSRRSCGWVGYIGGRTYRYVRGVPKASDGGEEAAAVARADVITTDVRTVRGCAGEVV
jgi:hypothetical protein